MHNGTRSDDVARRIGLALLEVEPLLRLPVRIMP
jgi:hypothetical protein